jgi:hypothetical protein
MDKHVSVSKTSQDIQVQENISGLPPIVHDPSSPYYHPNALPQTPGDYHQRVLNKLNQSSKLRKINLNWRSSPWAIGLVLVTTTVAAVYASNVIMVYDKERTVESLLLERNRLREILNNHKNR